MVHGLFKRAVGAVARRSRDELGTFAVIVALSVTAVAGTAALVIDIGNARQVRRAAQTAADAAALAGVKKIEDINSGWTGSSTQWAQVVTAVKNYALYNFNVKTSDWVGCSDSG